MSYAKPVPSGTTIMFAGMTPPNGWFVCDGRELNVADYLSLFEVLGYKWGGNGTTKFNIPDMRGIFVRGVDGAINRDPDSKDRTFIKSGGSTGNNIGSFQANNFGSHGHESNSFESKPYNLSHAHGSTNSFESSHRHQGFMTANHSHKHSFNYVTKLTIGQDTTGDYTYGFWDQETTKTIDTDSKLLDDHSATVNNANDSHGHTVDQASPSHSHNLSVTVSSYTGKTETRPKNVYVNYIIKI